MAKQPEIPDKNNPFDKLTSSLMKMLGGFEQRDKERIAQVDRLIKQMIVYYKLLEDSYNKNKIISKKGKDFDLNNDKGFLKLIDLMTKTDSSLKNVVDKYIQGQRLNISEKADLAKFVKDLNESVSETKEQVGVSLTELLKNFKLLLQDSKLSESFKLDLIKYLKEYSQEDVALSKQLKEDLDKILKQNKVDDERIVEVLTKLNETIENSSDEDKSRVVASFAPYKKINNSLKDANIALDDILETLKDGQKKSYQTKDSQDNKEKTPFGNLKDRMQEDTSRGISKAVGTATNIGTKYLALKASENEMTRGISPYLYAGSDFAGGLAQDLTNTGLEFLKLKMMGSAVSGRGMALPRMNISQGLEVSKKLGTKAIEGTGKVIHAGKNIAPRIAGATGNLAKGFGGVASKLAIPVTLGMAGINAVSGFNKTEGGTLSKVQGASASMLSGMSLGLIPEKQLKSFSDSIGASLGKPLGDALYNLQKFTDEQNREIFGDGLDLAYLLQKALINPIFDFFRPVNSLFSFFSNMFPQSNKSSGESTKEQVSNTVGSVAEFITTPFGKDIQEKAKKAGKSLGSSTYDVASRGYGALSNLGGRKDRDQSASFKIGQDSYKAEQLDRKTLSSILSKDNKFESLAQKKSWYNPNQFQNDIPYAQKGTVALLDKLSQQGIGFEVSGAMGTATSVHKAGRGKGQGHYSGTKLDFVPKKGETMQSLTNKLASTGYFSRVANEGDHVDVQIKKEYLDLFKKQKQEVQDKSKQSQKLNKDLKQIQSKPVDMPKIPNVVKPTITDVKKTENSPTIIQQNKGSTDKSLRKLKSDNELLNVYNTTGVLG